MQVVLFNYLNVLSFLDVDVGFRIIITEAEKCIPKE